MIFDAELLFSDGQAVTATAASTNVVDLGSSGVGKGAKLYVGVSEAFADGTSVAVSIEVDDNAAFASAATLLSTPAIPVATLVVGYEFALDRVPKQLTEQYMRIKYTVVGTPTAGKIDAGIVV